MDAVIPAAGRGIRMQAITCGAPKELLPVNGIPLIVHTLQEAVDAGVTRIYIIINPRKPELHEYLVSRRRKSQARLEINKHPVYFSELRQFGIECIFLEQKEPRGVGHAVSLIEPYVTDNDFLVLMPDNYYPAKPSPAVQLINTYTPGLCCMGILKLTPDVLPYFSKTNVVEFERNEGKTVSITSLSDKQRDNFPDSMQYSIYRGVGRCIYSRDFFRIYHLLEDKGISEIDDIPILRRLMEEGKMEGCLLEGTGFDAGNPAGYAAACEYFQPR